MLSLRIKNTILNSLKKFTEDAIVDFVNECIDLQWFLEIYRNVIDFVKRGKHPYDKKGNDGCVCFEQYSFPTLPSNEGSLKSLVQV
ncbi:hypothetical protein [uncultured Aquimarina sp.]|uniref:hypothetical protein n=1 Tax=uncultured Aquimarina sp. TaxID=575652 RepID=UPI0026395D5C|nr:hypothetical protein [uncultured Aquimarina sp.]